MLRHSLAGTEGFYGVDWTHYCSHSTNLHRKICTTFDRHVLQKRIRESWLSYNENDFYALTSKLEPSTERCRNRKTRQIVGNRGFH